MGKSARQIISQKGREFREKAVPILVQSGIPRIEEPVEVTIRLYPPTKRAFDLDNFSKGILDAMQHADILEDDHLVHRLVVEKMEKDKPGRSEVTIKEL